MGVNAVITTLVTRQLKFICQAEHKKGALSLKEKGWLAWEGQ